MLARSNPMFQLGHTPKLREKQLTMHLSNDAARAPELETSNVIFFLFFKISCSLSKFVAGGGKCRL
jgi:hypothetical protein